MLRIPVPGRAGRGTACEELLSSLLENLKLAALKQSDFLAQLRKHFYSHSAPFGHPWLYEVFVFDKNFYSLWLMRVRHTGVAALMH